MSDPYGAVTGETTGEATARGVAGPRPSIAGRRVTDVSAVAGGAVWLVAVVALELDAVERTLALAPLVIVPLGLGLATDAGFDGHPARTISAAVIIQPFGAALLLASLARWSGSAAAVAAAGWLPVTGLMTLAGLRRALDRGLAPLSETLVDAGLAYASVGAVALVLWHLGITFWFDPTILLLTAVHFHFAGFALPVLAGITGRYLGNPGRAFRPIAAVILVGPAFIAVGISFSPLVEFVSVGLFTLAVASFGGYVLLRVVPTFSPVPGALLALSALALPVSMLLALGYGVAVFTGSDPLGLGISRMVSLHGSLNAYGFALLGMVAWRIA